MAELCTPLNVYLESCWTVHDDLRCLSQRPTGLVFSLGSDHFSSGITSSLSLSSHGSLELLGNPDVLHLHPLHHDAPGLGALIKNSLHLSGNGFSLTENISQGQSSQHIPQSGGGQQPGGPAV